MMPTKALVVEDDATVRGFIAAVLERDGYEVITAESVAEARTVLAAQAPNELCLVVDVVLQDQSGIQFAQELLDRYPKCRVLLISGFTDEVILTQPEHAGRIGFLPKPFTRDSLLPALEKLCG